MSDIQLADATTLNEDAELLLVRNLRVKALNQYIKDGKISEDVEEANLTLKLLKDLDASAIARKRIQTDAKANEAVGNVAALVAEALKSINGNTGRAETVVLENTPESLPDHLVRKDFLPGELDQGTMTETYDAFMAKHADHHVE